MNDKIKRLFEIKSYQEIINMYEDSIMMNNNIKFVDFKSETIYAIIFSLLINNMFDDIDFLVIRLKKENVFDYSYVFLILCSYLKQVNILKALSFAGEIALFKSDEFNKLIGEDESSYTNILKCDDVDKIPCLLLYVLIGSLASTKIKTIDDVMINYFEILDIVYQSSADYEIIEYMMNIAKILVK